MSKGEFEDLIAIIILVILVSAIVGGFLLPIGIAFSRELWSYALAS